MNPAIGRLLHRTEIGLAIGDHEVSACAIAISPWRRAEVARVTAPYQPDCLSAAVKDVIEACLKGGDRAQVRVTIGLPALRLFFSSLPISDKQTKDSPQTLLHNLIHSSTFVIDDMSVDMVKHKYFNQTLAGLVSCREKYLSGVLGALEAAGISPVRAEPTPCALVRLAGQMHRPPRKAKALVRVFLGAHDGLAVLVTKDDLPLCWRPFELSAGGELAAILAAVGSVRVHGKQCGVDTGMGAVMIHGRPDLAVLEGMRASAPLAGLEILGKESPTLDVGDAALGLTLPPKAGIESFNLVRSKTGPPRFLDIFPWGQALAAVALLIAATLFLSYRLRGQRAVDQAVRAEDAKLAWAAKLTSEKLAAEKKDLEQKIETIRGFLDTRILWTSYTRALAGRLTPELAIVSIMGTYELESPGSKARPKRAITIRFTAPIPRTGALPQEIDAFLRNLRAAPLLKKDFPEVDLADLRWIPGQGAGKAATANFSVVCQPAKTAAPKPQVDPAAKGKGR